MRKNDVSEIEYSNFDSKNFHINLDHKEIDKLEVLLSH